MNLNSKKILPCLTLALKKIGLTTLTCVFLGGLLSLEADAKSYNPTEFKELLKKKKDIINNKQLSERMIAHLILRNDLESALQDFQILISRQKWSILDTILAYTEDQPDEVIHSFFLIVKEEFDKNKNPTIRQYAAALLIQADQTELGLKVLMDGDLVANNSYYYIGKSLIYKENKKHQKIGLNLLKILVKNGSLEAQMELAKYDFIKGDRQKGLQNFEDLSKKGYKPVNEALSVIYSASIKFKNEKKALYYANLAFPHKKGESIKSISLDKNDEENHNMRIEYNGGNVFISPYTYNLED